MTKSEAREVIKKNMKCKAENCPPKPCHECDYFVSNEEWNEALTTVLEALEEPENGCFGSKKCECHDKTTDKAIPDSIREAVLNVLDDYADKTLEIESGAYEQARYAIGKILEG